MASLFIFSLLFMKFNLISSKCIENKSFDYIIVGSGSSGAVVATRLSENEEVSVLLLEAGGEPLAVSEVPLISFKALGTTMDWNYFSVPQKHCCKIYKNEVVPMSRGKALGGSSSINYMAYTRGNKLDFNTWNNQGNNKWDYQSVLPYFRKLEDYKVPRSRENDIDHHEGGPMTISIPSFKTPLADAFLQAGYEIGQTLVDYNVDNQTGFNYPPVFVKDGARCSTYTGYLKPVMNRKNLHILTHALVTKIIIDDEKRATGVIYERESSECVANAKNEVILSAGVFNSPQLLMLSGIGPKETLEKFDIDLKVNLPGVGQNLQDHVVLGGFMYSLNQTVSYNGMRYMTKKYLDLWKKTRTGPMTCPEGFEGIAFYQSKYTDITDWPDIEVYYNSDNILRTLKPHLKPVMSMGIPSDDKEVINFLPMLLRPKSRGYISLTSKNPHDPPLIDPNYLSHPDDVKVLAEGIKFVQNLAATDAFRKYGANLVLNGIIPNCILYMMNPEEHVKCMVTTLSSTAYHPTSSCKMGPEVDPMAVVDERLRVHGIKGLRVVDASIMPNIISGDPSTSCMMIGEKASDMIKQDYEQ